ncbi:VanZ family protein [Telluria mixta]|uniref:VanZ family protein n=1 Tax=Telluria mixta TaxID=34071 RepID=A0ABT2CA83_9BURK|nr:VanZ family protein [Telluria mixta]MCS0633706.1 VanZ family protein [Telluria mixta]WEM98126.1 VanZ family protein [Telluria mixta]
MTETEDAAGPRASPVARAALLAYLLLIVYASWFPFSGWRSSGLSPFAFLVLQMPRWWTGFDVMVNIVGYMPFGTLIVLALHPRVRGLWAVAIAAVVGLLVSGTMEVVQNYLPSRVPSSLDLLTNAGGCLAGAVIGAWFAPMLLDRSRLYLLRQRWFAAHASQGLVLVALWPLAQVYPQNYLFGNGQILPLVSEWLSDWLDTDIDLVTMLRGDVPMSVEQYWLSETIITACGMTGAALTLLCLTRRGAPRLSLMLALIGVGIVVKTLASSLFFAPDNAFVWVTPGAEGGFLIGLIMLAGLAFAPQVAQRRLAVVTLVLSLIVVNTIPANPYFVSTLQAWQQGKFLNFNGAAQFLDMAWPVIALWFLLLPSHRLNRQ